MIHPYIPAGPLGKVTTQGSHSNGVCFRLCESHQKTTGEQIGPWRVPCATSGSGSSEAGQEQDYAHSHVPWPSCVLLFL